jgi:hypothetical protein
LLTEQIVIYENQQVKIRHATSSSKVKQCLMKSLFLILYILNTQFQTELQNSNSNNAVAGQNIKIMLSNHLAGAGHTDEVLITLDKADHTGAGVVIKKYWLNAGNTITLTGVPEGKYIATVKFIGLHNDIVEGRLNVGKKKNNMLKIKLAAYEIF